MLINSEIILKIFLNYIGIILEYLDARDMKLSDMKLPTLDSPLRDESNKLLIIKIGSQDAEIYHLKFYFRDFEFGIFEALITK